MKMMRVLNIACALWWLWLIVDVLSGNPLGMGVSICACLLAAFGFIQAAVDSD